MSQFYPAWRRHVRLDALRYLRPEEIQFLQSNFEPGERLQSQASDTERARTLEQPRGSRRVPEVKFDAETAWRRHAIAKLRLDWELLKFALGGRKARYQSKYNPNQPRVPAGSAQGGQWSSEGAQGTPTRLAGEPPGIGHNKPPVDGKSPIPKIKPSDRDTRMAIVNRLARLGGPLGALISAAPWLREYAGEIQSYQDPPKTREELQQAVSDLPKPGYQKHHINEVAAARDAKDPEDLIQSPDNLVAIPTQKHRLITGWFARKNDDPPYNGLSPREYLQDKSWEERQRIGLQKLIDFEVMKP